MTHPIEIPLDSLSPDPNFYGRLVFKCRCGTVQSYAPPGTAGGISLDEAVALEWKYFASTGTWVCPVCRELQGAGGA